ncbi:hypothetical protein SAMN05421676_101268 [Salinibacillus kushneri]|uniref:Uncharacterized protein n=1 Tax=Salinibacillus kushneri TaxID=237682 RepID=A0A1H9YRK6_9BACI|nr:DUF6470 family protein [Salinibacillus kushneri]SES71779.1 hypothetical protein SAMN05421676_101268 [Salinibacillus kushneri]
MKIPQIRIQSQKANIEINSIPGQQSIEQRKAIQTIEQPKADMKIQTRPGKLTIDQTQAWRDMGMVNPVEFAENLGQQGRQSVLEGTARRAGEGDQLMKIENGGNPIVSQAVANAYEPMKEFNIGWIPSPNAVKINYEPAEVTTNVQPNEPRISVQPQKPAIHYQPGQVETNLKQQPELNIDFVSIQV